MDQADQYAIYEFLVLNQGINPEVSEEIAQEIVSVINDVEAEIEVNKTRDSQSH